MDLSNINNGNALAALQMIAQSAMRYLPLIVLPTLSPFSFAPVMVRSVLLLAISIIAVGVQLDAIAMPAQLAQIAFLKSLASELLLGLLFAFACYLPIAAMDQIGRILDMQIGLSAAALIFPNISQEAQAPMSTLFTLAALTLVFTLGLHLEALRNIALSLQLVPLGSNTFEMDAGHVVEVFSAQLTLALLLVAPTMIALFVIDVATNYATRAMPQANVFFLMLPVKVLVGLLMVTVSLKQAPETMRQMFDLSQALMFGAG
jgi:flagellar biosynthesis protein FliR